MILICLDKIVHCTAPILEKVVVDGQKKIKIYFDSNKLDDFYLMEDIYGPNTEIITGVEVPDLSIKYRYIDGQFIPYNPPIV